MWLKKNVLSTFSIFVCADVYARACMCVRLAVFFPTTSRLLPMEVLKALIFLLLWRMNGRQACGLLVQSCLALLYFC